MQPTRMQETTETKMEDRTLQTSSSTMSRSANSHTESYPRPHCKRTQSLETIDPLPQRKQITMTHYDKSHRASLDETIQDLKKLFPSRTRKVTFAPELDFRSSYSRSASCPRLQQITLDDLDGSRLVPRASIMPLQRQKSSGDLLVEQPLEQEAEQGRDESKTSRKHRLHASHNPEPKTAVSKRSSHKKSSKDDDEKQKQRRRKEHLERFKLIMLPETRRRLKKDFEMLKSHDTSIVQPTRHTATTVL